MVENVQLHTYKKKMRLHLSKSLNVVKAWEFLSHFVAEHIAGVDYSHTPFLVDIEAYRIGHIFVQEPSEIHCFCAAPVLKILGPLRDFVVRQKTNSKWLDKDLHAIKSTADHLNFRVELENGKNRLTFKAWDCFFLNKAADMSVEGDVTVDRSSHEDLSRAEWFGLITDVVVAVASEVYIVRNHRERKFYIGATPHTILFKYEICKIDDKGSVYETTNEKMECKWLPVQDRELDSLPLTQFVSQSTKIKS